MQVAWAYKGIPSTNQAVYIVKEYFDKKLLTGLGYRFDAKELKTWEVEAFNLIEKKLQQLRDADSKKNLRKK